MLDISNLLLILFVQFYVRQHTVMNLVPSLNSLRHFRMLFFKNTRNLMKLSKEFTPGKNDLFVFHPFKLNKIKKLSFGPLKDDNNKLLISVNKLVLGFQERHRATDMVEMVLAEEVNKKDFVSDSLPAFLLRVRSDSNRELFLLSLRIYFNTLKSMILRAFN